MSISKNNWRNFWQSIFYFFRLVLSLTFIKKILTKDSILPCRLVLGFCFFWLFICYPYFLTPYKKTTERTTIFIFINVSFFPHKNLKEDNIFFHTDGSYCSRLIWVWLQRSIFWVSRKTRLMQKRRSCYGMDSLCNKELVSESIKMFFVS